MAIAELQIQPVTNSLNEEYSNRREKVRDRAANLAGRHKFLAALNRQFPRERHKRNGSRNPEFVISRGGLVSETQGLSSIQTLEKLELRKLRKKIMRGGV